MAGETSKVKTRLANLNASLGELESLLEPLLAQSLPETTMGLEPIQQAKLQTVLPYLIYDLLFIYLKTKGVDPKTHTVISELERVRRYFEKITHAENPPIRRNEVDKDAAGRFIKHAITQAMSRTATDTQSTPPPLSVSVPVKVTTKMVARAQYERTLEKERQEQGEEDVLEVYDELDSDSSDDSENTSLPTNKKENPSSDQVASKASKRWRTPMDLFADHGEACATTKEPSAKRPRPEPQNGKPKDDTPCPRLLVDSMAAAASSSRKPRKKKTSKNWDK